MVGIYLLLGSNLGDRRLVLERAIKEIASRIGPILNQSSLYHTASVDMAGAPDFINQVVQVDTRMNHHALLYHCLCLEIAEGRQHLHPGQSRYLDIDLLYYHDQVLDSPLLTIPHPRIQQRRFVLEPLAEIAPMHLHPVLKKTHRELLALCTDRSKVERILI